MVSGTVSGKAVHIALAALRGEVLVSTALSGALADDTMDGSYVRSDSKGNAAIGEFTAKISPEVESYIPVEVASSSKAFEDVAEEQVYEPSEIESSSAKALQSRYRDVSKLKDSINQVILPRRAPL